MQPAKNTHAKRPNVDKTTKVATTSSIGISYDLNSEEEDDTVAGGDTNSVTDFFALTATESVSDRSHRTRHFK